MVSSRCLRQTPNNLPKLGKYENIAIFEQIKSAANVISIYRSDPGGLIFQSKQENEKIVGTDKMLTRESVSHEMWQTEFKQ